jgi:hypothetical protein
MGSADDDLITVGKDDRERPVIRHGFSEDRVEALLVGGDEGGSLGVAIGVEHGFNQPFIGEFACPGGCLSP